MKYLLPLLLAIVPILAFAAGDDIVIVGAGTQDCAAWQEARDQHDESVDLFLASWVQGFLSGMNAQRQVGGSGEMVALPESDALLASVDRHCQAHPDHTVFQASLVLYQSLQQK
jgi:hypothetical protein